MKDKANAFEVGRTYVIKVTMDGNESDYVLSVRVLRRTPKTVTVIGDTAYTAEAKTCRPRIDPWTVKPPKPTPRASEGDPSAPKSPARGGPEGGQSPTGVPRTGLVLLSFLPRPNQPGFF